ncbi:Type II/IV secretion system protein [Microbacterium azadirachtae]|uniref:Type II/IV secretion system protein n=1 Tax=Microbacterium azadirachtae TaxID=582680 RepID=A0A0F0KZB9_9MICO|nr:Type II/IV secretion system protein [Microbacterium azadirachtae]
MSLSTAAVTERVRARLRADRTDPSVHPEEAHRIAQFEVRRHNDQALARGTATIDDEAACVRDILAGVAGYGPLQPLLDDDTVEEIWLNGPAHVFVARDGRSERVPLALTEAQLRDTVERMLHAAGRRVDLGQPFVDASLPDGSRLHVAIADVVRGAWSVNLRKFLPRYRSLDALVRQGMVPAEVAGTLAEAMRAGRSVIVSGPTHAGKAKPAIMPHSDQGFSGVRDCSPAPRGHQTSPASRGRPSGRRATSVQHGETSQRLAGAEAIVRAGATRRPADTRGGRSRSRGSATGRCDPTGARWAGCPAGALPSRSGRRCAQGTGGSAASPGSRGR